eukprot:1178174-Prorocentrum_minimum.AAC.1
MCWASRAKARGEREYVDVVGARTRCKRRRGCARYVGVWVCVGVCGCARATRRASVVEGRRGGYGGQRGCYGHRRHHAVPCAPSASLYYIPGRPQCALFVGEGKKAVAAGVDS